eukprot:scaffold235896_cov31-Tisochrysis_lutea.AAC.3
MTKGEAAQCASRVRAAVGCAIDEELDEWDYAARPDDGQLVLTISKCQREEGACRVGAPLLRTAPEHSHEQLDATYARNGHLILSRKRQVAQCASSLRARLRRPFVE